MRRRPCHTNCHVSLIRACAKDEIPQVKVKIWFQNRRMKWRNSKERELLSSGGSREQTLPTKHNPNPDLSDVGTYKDSQDCENGLLKTPMSPCHSPPDSPVDEDSNGMRHCPGMDRSSDEIDIKVL
ncbi:hypothetical protein JTE90_029528 [Oedothorax gibbosus]|uniref:Homeobox domain-containing protein n=1 Tax=Oedothorax gibbosus TaxID=931172 RepID=A0AAV6VCR3_9ARAC|nr:hypothetical protein JTE90_029528 [Oedothorax gibbosus]